MAPSFAFFDESVSEIGSRIFSGWDTMVGQEEDAAQAVECILNETKSAKKSFADGMATDKLYRRIETLELVAGVSPGDYVNVFVLAYNELNEMKGHEMGEERAKFLFVSKIRDPEFEGLKTVLQNEFYNKSLMEMANIVFASVAEHERRRQQQAQAVHLRERQMLGLRLRRDDETRTYTEKSPAIL
jgi:hypothetical protein